MKALLQRAAIGINRRRFLERSTTAVFGVLAGTALRPSNALASHTQCIYPCVGPYQSTYCGAVYCNGVGCGTNCSYVSGFCVGTAACWSYGHNGKVCCDCRCRAGVESWYCFCGN